MKDIFICVVKENNRTTFFFVISHSIFKATMFFFLEADFFKEAWVVYVSGVVRRAINLKICHEASDLHSCERKLM